MAEKRLSREFDTRAVSERPQQWALPESLPEPDKRPATHTVGFAFPL